MDSQLSFTKRLDLKRTSLHLELPRHTLSKRKAKFNEGEFNKYSHCGWLGFLYLAFFYLGFRAHTHLLRDLSFYLWGWASPALIGGIFKEHAMYFGELKKCGEVVVGRNRSYDHLNILEPLSTRLFDDLYGTRVSPAIWLTNGDQIHLIDTLQFKTTNPNIRIDLSAERLDKQAAIVGNGQCDDFAFELVGVRETNGRDKEAEVDLIVFRVLLTLFHEDFLYLVPILHNLTFGDVVLGPQVSQNYLLYLLVNLIHVVSVLPQNPQEFSILFFAQLLHILGTRRFRAPKLTHTIPLQQKSKLFPLRVLPFQCSKWRLPHFQLLPS